MPDTLVTVLQNSDMLLIDDLHAFDFTFDPATGLKAAAMDGRDLKRWEFNPEQVNAATMNNESGCWEVSDEKGVHQLVCVQAFTASDEDEPEQE
jgi:hypothetical protein